MFVLTIQSDVLDCKILTDSPHSSLPPAWKQIGRLAASSSALHSNSHKHWRAGESNQPDISSLPFHGLVVAVLPRALHMFSVCSPSECSARCYVFIPSDAVSALIWTILHPRGSSAGPLLYFTNYYDKTCDL